MARIPSMQVTDGKSTAIINTSDLAAWEARGWQPETQTKPAKDEVAVEIVNKKKTKPV